MSARPAPPVRSRILILAPHPDDEALAVGGLLQRAMHMGAEIHLLFVTDGENNPWAQRATERRWRIGSADQERWRMRRRGEALASLACLGVPMSRASFLAFPDQGLTDLLMQGGGDLCAVLLETLERIRPTLLITPDADDLHPDHSALALIASFARGAMSPRIPRPRSLQFIVHARRPRRHAELALRLTVEEHRHKRAAILCHGSQLTCRRKTLLAHGDEPEEFIVTAPHVTARGDHPVRSASVEEGALVLELAPRARLGAWGPTELLLVAASDEGTQSFRMSLPKREGLAEIERWGDRSLAASATVERGAGRARVTVPAALVAGSHTVFVKLERRHGFFDEAGWRGALCAPVEEAAPGRAPSASGAALPGQAPEEEPWSVPAEIVHMLEAFEGVPSPAIGSST
jgi:LmbE family N-acetylglucosaminyl deacetylase